MMKAQNPIMLATLVLPLAILFLLYIFWGASYVIITLLCSTVKVVCGYT
jgi:hypothetical protein